MPCHTNSTSTPLTHTSSIHFFFPKERKGKRNSHDKPIMMKHSITITLILLSLITLSNAKTLKKNNQGSNNDMVKQFLSMQNAARAVLRLPPLVWDKKLANYAQWYANQRRFDCALQHSNGPYGENIFWGSGNAWTPAQAASDWVSERRLYNYWSNSCAFGQDCGHYTQIVWKDTKRVGCARVVCNGGRGVFMVCDYDPPGNYIGERPY